MSATANPGYAFTGFSGALGVTNPSPSSLPLTAPASVTANFALSDFTLTIAPSSAVLVAGDTTTFPISAAALNGFSDAITLAPADCPSGGNALTANVLVYDFDGVLTPDDNFEGRSLTDFGVGETISLSLTTTPSITAAQAGDFVWQVVTGGGDLTDNGDGNGRYFVPDSTAALGLALQIKKGPSKGTAKQKNANQVAPTDAYQIQKPGTNLFHTQGIYSVGHRDLTYLMPKDVSFKNIEVREGYGVVSASDYLVGANGDTHNPGVFLSVASCVKTTGCLLVGDDTVEIVGDSGPFGRGGVFDLPIPREYRIVGSSVQPKKFTTMTHHAIADFQGTATSTKGGAGPFTRRVTDPPSSY